MAVSKAQLESNKRYSSKFDDVRLRVPKGYRETIREHADKQSESVNGFIMRAIKETIEHDNQK